MKMNRGIKAQAERQKILDLLNEHGKMTYRKIGEICGIGNPQWPLSWMVTNGELFRSDERPSYYTALVGVTMSADNVQKQRFELANQTFLDKNKKVSLSANHRIVNLLDKPARDNTGQRSRVGGFAYSGMYAQQF
jgi:hypothetical protein